MVAEFRGDRLFLDELLRRRIGLDGRNDGQVRTLYWPRSRKPSTRPSLCPAEPSTAPGPAMRSITCSAVPWSLLTTAE
jgi:hypothetical protein